MAPQAAHGTYLRSSNQQNQQQLSGQFQQQQQQQPPQNSLVDKSAGNNTNTKKKHVRRLHMKHEKVKQAANEEYSQITKEQHHLKVRCTHD